MRTMVCIAVALACAGNPPRASQGSVAADASAAQWLDRAETWLGGHEQLARVAALEIERGGGETIRILLPDKYQIETTASFGKTTVTFDGKTIWTRSDLPALNEPAADAPPPDVLRHRALTRLTEMTLTYLARPPAANPIAARVNDDRCGMLDGVCIAFERAGEAPIFFVLARNDGRPLAVVRTSGTQEYVSELGDYRTVSGVKFPFKIVSRRRELPNGKPQVLGTWSYRSYLVNPPLRAADFMKAPKH